MPLRYAYNTNGLSHHRLDDALELLAETGYDGVALTLDHAHLDPFAPGAHAEAARVAGRLRELGLGCVIETGARFLLDPRAKHEPTLVTADAGGRARRVDFLRRCLDVAAVLGAEAVSFWAGVPAAGLDREGLWPQVADGVAELLPLAAEHGVALAFEPEPGMLVEHVADWRRLVVLLEERTGDRVGEGVLAPFGLALDTGHCVVAGDLSPEGAVRDAAPHLRAVSVEGMRRGVHEHLPLDEGDVDVPAVLAALTGVGYDRLVSVELSRDAHRAHAMVPRALEQLRAAERGAR